MISAQRESLAFAILEPIVQALLPFRLCYLNRPEDGSCTTMAYVHASSLPGGGQHAMRLLVLQIWDQLPGLDGDDAGARSESKPLHGDVPSSPLRALTRDTGTGYQG